MKHKVIPEGNDLWIHLNEEYDGIIFKYDRVAFDVQNENTPEEEAFLQFHYDLHPSSVKVTDTETFEKYLGDLLLEILQEQLKKNEVVYYGGT